MFELKPIANTDFWVAFVNMYLANMKLTKEKYKGVRVEATSELNNYLKSKKNFLDDFIRVRNAVLKQKSKYLANPIQKAAFYLTYEQFILTMKKNKWNQDETATFICNLE